jgi:heme-degrading monooxygenase HmoA
MVKMPNNDNSHHNLIISSSIFPLRGVEFGHLNEKEEPTMHIQIVNFNLKDMGDKEFHKMCDELAPAFASLPGLISKVWLADPATNTYGGVYIWRDRGAWEVFTKSELFQAVGAHPNLTNITSRDFGVLEGPTRVTNGLIAAAV